MSLRLDFDEQAAPEAARWVQFRAYWQVYRVGREKSENERRLFLGSKLSLEQLSNGHGQPATSCPRRRTLFLRNTRDEFIPDLPGRARAGEACTAPRAEPGASSTLKCEISGKPGLGARPHVYSSLIPPEAMQATLC